MVEETNCLRQELAAQVEQIYLVQGELEILRRNETETFSQLETVRQEKVNYQGLEEIQGTVFCQRCQCDDNKYGAILYRT